MTSKTAGFLVMLGLLITAGGIGGVETSITDAELIGAVLISTVGLLIMSAGTAALRVSDYYDRIQHNSTLR